MKKRTPTEEVAMWKKVLGLDKEKKECCPFCAAHEKKSDLDQEEEDFKPEKKE